MHVYNWVQTTMRCLYPHLVLGTTRDAVQYEVKSVFICVQYAAIRVWTTCLITDNPGYLLMACRDGVLSVCLGWWVCGAGYCLLWTHEHATCLCVGGKGWLALHMHYSTLNVAWIVWVFSFLTLLSLTLLGTTVYFNFISSMVLPTYLSVFSVFDGVRLSTFCHHGDVHEEEDDADN